MAPLPHTGNDYTHVPMFHQATCMSLRWTFYRPLLAYDLHFHAFLSRFMSLTRTNAQWIALAQLTQPLLEGPNSSRAICGSASEWSSVQSICRAVWYNNYYCYNMVSNDIYYTRRTILLKLTTCRHAFATAHREFALYGTALFIIYIRERLVFHHEQWNVMLLYQTGWDCPN